MSEKALVPIEQKQVEFYGDELTAVLAEDGRVYVPIRPICELIGVDWNGQRRRINRDPVLGEELRTVDVTSTEGGRVVTRSVICLPLDYTNGFLFGLNADRVRPDLRDKVIRYQRECYRVLADAFLSPVTAVSPIDASDQVLMQLHNMALVIAAATKEMMEARRLVQVSYQAAQDNSQRLDLAREYMRGMNKRLKLVEERTAVGPLTPEQAEELRYLVNQIAELYTQREPGKKHYPSVYAALERETGATSYKAIPPKGFEAARAFLEGWLQSLQKAE